MKQMKVTSFKMQGHINLYEKFVRNFCMFIFSLLMHRLLLLLLVGKFICFQICIYERVVALSILQLFSNKKEEEIIIVLIKGVKSNW